MRERRGRERGGREEAGNVVKAGRKQLHLWLDRRGKKAVAAQPSGQVPLSRGVLSKLAIDTVGRQFEPYLWRPCGVTWDVVPEHSW